MNLFRLRNTSIRTGRPVIGLSLLLTVCLVADDRAGASQPPKGLPVATPASLGVSLSRLNAIDGLVERHIAAGEMAGAVVLIGYRGQIIFQKAYGNRQVEPAVEPMTVDTVFDLASLTKPIATATAVMQLVDAEKLELDEPVAKWLPEFAANGKEQITVRDLLTHQSGLIADNAMKDYSDNLDATWHNILTLKPVAEPRTRFIYSDMGFITLGRLVEKVSGQPLDDFVQNHLARPLGMSSTTYCPGAELAARCAATERRNDRWMKGEVHDPRAYALGGVAGHAGLFSTADDLARYAQMIVNGGEYGGTRVLSEDSVRLMASPQPVPGGIRGLGWDKRSAYSSNRGDLMSDDAIGHGGFTGTGIWIDPQQQMFVIFLSTRLHPDGKGSVNPLIGRIGTIATAALPFTADE